MCKLERGKSVLSFFKEKCQENVWSGYGEPKVQLGEVNVFY